MRKVLPEGGDQVGAAHVSERVTGVLFRCGQIFCAGMAAFAVALRTRNRPAFGTMTHFSVTFWNETAF